MILDDFNNIKFLSNFWLISDIYGNTYSLTFKANWCSGDKVYNSVISFLNLDPPNSLNISKVEDRQVGWLKNNFEYVKVKDQYVVYERDMSYDDIVNVLKQHNNLI